MRVTYDKDSIRIKPTAPPLEGLVQLIDGPNYKYVSPAEFLGTDSLKEFAEEMTANMKAYEEERAEQVRKAIEEEFGN